ncbi:MAG TPA: hypothetical protein PK637_11050, partial [Flavobacteriales bacterium]|nr:hypothetical protein [Flavobacteriales bacterium]
FSLWEKDKFRFEKNDNEFRYVGTGSENDSGFTTYYTDRVNLKSYIIDGKSDTSFIYNIEYDVNGNLIKEKCIKGGTYTTEYFYAGKVLKKVHTEFSDTSETFNIWEYDNEHRVILFKYFLRKETDSVYNYISYEYNDSMRTKTEFYGSLYHPTTYEKIITYFNKKGLPEKLEYEFSDEGVIKTRFTVIYK